MSYVFKINLPECPANVELQELISTAGNVRVAQKFDSKVKEAFVEFSEEVKEGLISLRYIGVNGKVGGTTTRVIPITKELPPVAPPSFAVSFDNYIEEAVEAKMGPVESVVEEAKFGPSSDEAEAEAEYDQLEAEAKAEYDRLEAEAKHNEEVAALVLKAKAAYEAEEKSKTKKAKKV